MVIHADLQTQEEVTSFSSGMEIMGKYIECHNVYSHRISITS